MKKRTPILILAVVLAFSLLTLTAFADAPSYEGYEAFKSLMQNKSNLEQDVKNGSLVGSVTLQENNQVLITMGGTLKADADLKAGNADVSIQAGEINRNLNVFFNDDVVYVFDELAKEYYSVTKTDDMKSEYYDEDGYSSENDVYTNHSGKMTSAQEELMDFLVGELKDDFEVTYNSDESQTISFELTNSEMPMLLNLLVSAGNSMEKDEFEATTDNVTNEKLSIYPLFKELSTIDASIPVIEDNLKLNIVKFSLTVDGNQDFRELAFSLNVSGDDISGANHTQQVDGKFSLSNVGTTTVDAPVLEGKEIISIDPVIFESTSEFNHSGRVHRGIRGGN